MARRSEPTYSWNCILLTRRASPTPGSPQLSATSFVDFRAPVPTMASTISAVCSRRSLDSTSCRFFIQRRWHREGQGRGCWASSAAGPWRRCGDRVAPQRTNRRCSGHPRLGIVSRLNEAAVALGIAHGERLQDALSRLVEEGRAKR